MFGYITVRGSENKHCTRTLLFIINFNFAEKNTLVKNVILIFITKVKSTGRVCFWNGNSLNGDYPTGSVFRSVLFVLYIYVSLQLGENSVDTNTTILVVRER